MKLCAEFERRLLGYGLLTAEILYKMPDHPNLIQSFLWQTEDLAPKFPELSRFLDFWDRKIEATIHSVRVAHNALIEPAEFKYVDGEIRVH